MNQTEQIEKLKMEEKRRLKKMLNSEKDVDVLASVLKWNETDRNPLEAKPLIDFFVKFSKGLIFKDLHCGRSLSEDSVPDIVKQFETMKRFNSATASALKHVFKVARESGHDLEEESFREVEVWFEDYYQRLFRLYFPKRFFQRFVESVEHGEVLSKGLKQGMYDLLDVDEMDKLFDFSRAGQYMLVLEDKNIPKKYPSERWSEMLRVVLEKSFGMGHKRSQEMFDFSMGRYFETSDEPIRFHLTIPEGIETPDVDEDLDREPPITTGSRHFGFGCDLDVRFRAHDYALFMDCWKGKRTPYNYIFGESYIFSPSAFEIKGDAPMEVFENIKIFDYARRETKEKCFEICIRFE